jgi:hypothetical protein
MWATTDAEPCPRCGVPLRRWATPAGALLRLCGVANCRYGDLTPAAPRYPTTAERALAATLGVALSVPGEPSGPLRLDAARQRAFIGDDAIILSPTEYRILATLAAQPGRYVATAALARVLWGPGGDPRAVRVFVERLRRKLGDSATHPRHIQSARGRGYRLLHAPEP